MTFIPHSGHVGRAVCTQAYLRKRGQSTSGPVDTLRQILSPPRRTRCRGITRSPKAPPPPQHPSPAPRTDADSRTSKVQPQPARAAPPAAEMIGSPAERGRTDRNLNCPHALTGSKRFPFNNFTYYFTFFSKSFSSFPHGTCSLSVSRPYLALDEIYHPFWAVVPNNPTR